MAKTITIGSTGIQSAPVALGVMRMAGVSQEQADRVVMQAVESGITLFDNADIYGGGKSEEMFGEVLRMHPGLREKILVQSKCGICKGYYDASKAHILTSVDGILRRLKLDQLDFLLLHRPDALLEPEEVADAFGTLQKNGKVRFFGVSNQNSAQMELLKKYCGMPLMINQLQFGPAHTGMIDAGINVNIHSDYAVNRDGLILDYCRLNDITIQAWSPFMYGMFEGVFLKSEKYEKLNETLRRLAKEKGVSESTMAIAWILRHPAGIQVLLGTMNESHLKEACQAMTVQLSRPEWYEIYLSAGNPLP